MDIVTALRAIQRVVEPDESHSRNRFPARDCIRGEKVVLAVISRIVRQGTNGKAPERRDG